MQTTIVVILVAVAALYLIRRTVKQSNAKGGCGCGCDSCGQSCSESTGLADFRRQDATGSDRPGR